MIFELDHCSPDNFVLAMIGLLIVVKVSEAGTDLSDTIVVVVLGTVIVLVKLGVKAHHALVILQNSNLLTSQVAADHSLDPDQILQLACRELARQLRSVECLDRSIAIGVVNCIS